jgi:multicomponent Na+:H+ antiporter subunit B
MRDQAVPRVVAKLLIPYILLYALYVQWHGDYGPGGGFQAGVIFAAGIILYAIVFDLRYAQEAIRPGVVRILVPAGLLLYIGVGVAAMLKGGTFLDYSVLEHDPVHGQHLGILLIELGVGTTVAGVMISIFYAFGEAVRG